ncbi:hypothetical protein [Mucilaginibacter flavidus]|uniref:hypothetical protein n=1 Tax=Mucilaginibacter flavidus TaxID=2949309 RepID=UPI002091FBF4|nr:hypothetical protein [Mucilaginibacter flavidus]MCO5949422.1 hypothetical protein [Mucilaginibacter flavidus]
MIKSISITEPCSQSWQQMTPVDDGRHCESCCKTVVDFTTMTKEEIIILLSSGRNPCGRITSEQLAQINTSLRHREQPGFSWRKLGIASAVAGVFSVNMSDAQNRLPSHRHHLQSEINLTHAKQGRLKFLKIRGFTTKDIEIDAHLNGDGANVVNFEIDELNNYSNINNAFADQIAGIRVGGIQVHYSLPHRLWRAITWLARKLF